MNRREHIEQLTSPVLRLWGKTPDNTEELEAGWYHPVLFHLLDVGNVAKILWEQWFSERTRRWIADGMGLSIEEAGVVVVLLTALHDLGKASPTFQKKCEPLRLKLGLSCSNSCDSPHSFVTTKLLPDLLIAGRFGWQTKPMMALTLSKITGAHHGSFPTAGAMLGTHYGPATCGNGEWSQLQREMAEAVVHLLFPNTPAITMSLEDIERRAVGLVPYLAGLISVADWVGSEKGYFPILPPPTAYPEEYVKWSRKRAKQALTAFGWFKKGNPTPTKTFKELFGFPPNPLQQETEKLIAGISVPYLLLIEAAMGGGKTEAALWAADGAVRTGMKDGFYLALPTQAMSNAMLPRLTSQKPGKETGTGYLDRASLGKDLNLQLVHGNALLSEAFDALRMEARQNTADDTEDQNSRVLAEEWFTGKKRTLLAPFGVGTIDQTLLGVLQTRHWFVRLFGLAGKVIIFDEIHAYDVYMSALLANLISWLRELDCTVILLSATLPSAKRDELLVAWRGPKATAFENKEEYPRLTFAPTEGETKVVSVPESGTTTTPPPVALQWKPTDPAGLPKIIRESLPNGGCYAVICNTVARAQAVYDALSATLGKEEWEVILFHARTPFIWRQETEREILSKFSKNPDNPENVENAAKRPRRAVLVATQVAEQSIDLDFDGMATDLAPTDLILQRMGRLWRHQKRPKTQRHGVSGPLLTILCDNATDSETILPTFAPGSDMVYETYVLLRSYLTLREKPEIHLPADIPALVQTTYKSLDLSTLPDAFRDKMITVEDKMKRNQRKDESKAKGVSIPRPCAPEDLWDRLQEELRDDEDPTVHETLRASTRLGDPSITVICLGVDATSGATPGKDSDNSLKSIRCLREWSLSLSQRHLYGELCALPVPAAWKNSAHLRHCRPLEFTCGVAHAGGYTLRLTRERGLEILKELEEEKKQTCEEAE